MPNSYYFVQAPTHTSASEITQYDHALLAEAFNSRLLSGLGDGTKRIHLYNLGLFRQVRNPDESGLNYPALAEYLETYIHYSNDQVTWPIQPAGEAEGSNVSNPAMQFIFGVTDATNTLGHYGEGDALSDGIGSYLTGIGSPLDNWEAAKYQRGGYVFETGAQNAPMLDAAQEHSKNVFPDWSFYHKSYGGFVPQPVILKMCDQGEGTSQYPSKQIKFTYLGTDRSKDYVGTGTCGPNAGGSASDVMYIWNGPYAWYVYFFNGGYRRFDKAEYTQGPYTGGGTINRVDGDQIDRLLLNSYLKDFRGTPEQRPSGSCYNIMDFGFDFEYFMSSQYQLNPHRATVVGDSVQMLYPRVTLNNTFYPAGTNFGKYHISHSFVLGGIKVIGTGLKSVVSMSLCQDTHSVYNFTLNSGSSNHIATLPNGPTDEIYFRLRSTASLIAGGSIEVEFSELLAGKPTIEDLYAYLRLSTSNGGDGDDESDIIGDSLADSKIISDNYKAYGGVFNINGSSTVAQQHTFANNNPVLESARKAVRENTRVVNRQQFVGYKVINDGGVQKSVLYFKPTITYYGQTATVFDGLYQTSNSSSNGICYTAPTASWSNEWVMDISLKLYGGDITEAGGSTSEFKPSVYGDYFPLLNRCQLMSQKITSGKNPDVFAHGQQVNRSYLPDVSSQIASLYRSNFYAPETLSHLNYFNGINDALRYSDTNVEFYKSCQIYPEPYYIESAKLVRWNGVETVEIKLSGRLQHDDTAPATISDDFSTWDVTNLTSQVYRTDESGLMHYILAINGNDRTDMKVGDGANDSYEKLNDSGNPHACAIPHFFFTKLIPIPYASSVVCNTGSYDNTRTVVTCDRFIQMETCLRAMCEGYVNDTANLNCDMAWTNYNYINAYDFVFEDLCYKAFGDTATYMLPAVLNTRKPTCYGPLPNSIIYSGWQNQLAQCINLLTKVRVPLPFTMLGKASQYTGSSCVSPTWANNTTCLEGNNSYKAIIINAVSPPASGFSSGDEDYITLDDPVRDGLGVSTYASINGCCGDTINISSIRDIIEYKYIPLDADAVNAMSPKLYASYINGTGNSLFGKITTTTFIPKATRVYNGGSSWTCGDREQLEGNWSPFFEDDTGYAVDNDIYVSTYCGLITNGVLDAGTTPPVGDLLILTHNVGGWQTCTTQVLMKQEMQVFDTKELVVNIPTTASLSY